MTPEQVSAVVNEIREGVKERHEKTVPDLPDFRLPALDSLGFASDVAEGKVAAIGTVNPRPPGFVNNLIQAAKRRIARALNWFIRDQVDFNQAVLRHMDAQLEVAIEQNHAILRVAKTVGVPESDLKALRRQVDEMLDHWKQWRPRPRGKTHPLRDRVASQHPRDRGGCPRTRAGLRIPIRRLAPRLPPSPRSREGRIPPSPRSNQ